MWDTPQLLSLTTSTMNDQTPTCFEWDICDTEDAGYKPSLTINSVHCGLYIYFDHNPWRTHNKHLIARPWGRGMRCLLCVQCLTLVLCYHVMFNGPLARYVILWVAHAPGMPGAFSLPLLISDPDMHHGTWVTHVPWCMPGSLTSNFLWCWWRGKRSRHS